MQFDMPSPSLEDFRLEVRHSGSFRAYINGVLAATDLDAAGTHVPYPVSASARAALQPTGNVLAVHVVHTGLTDGARNIDLGLTAVQPPDFTDGPDPVHESAAWAVVANVVLNLDEALTKR